jgi:4-coumarate--CoA ligase
MFVSYFLTIKYDLHFLIFYFFPNISPFPPISEWRGKVALYEFIAEDFREHGGILNDEKVAIVDGNTSMVRTYRDYYTTATNLAGALRYDFNVIEHNTTIALFCPNHVDYLPIILAVSLCGAKVTPINPMYTSHELITILHQSHSAVLIVHTSTLNVALEAIKNNNRTHVKHVIVVTDDDNIKDIYDGTSTMTIDDNNTFTSDTVPYGTVKLDYLRQHGQAFDETVVKVRKNPETSPVILPYSSGTTGLPKGVCLSHYNIISNLLQLEQVEGKFIEPFHTMFTPLPFYHIYALTVALLYSAWQGLQLVTMSKKFDLKKFCHIIQDYEPDRCHVVPPILLRLANDPIVDQYNLSSIRTFVSAAAPLSREIEVAVEQRVGSNCRVKQIWGMSELSPVGTINSDDAIKSGSIGQLISSTIGKVLDTSGNSLPPNQSGELVIQGPQVMMGYMDNPDQTRECLSDQGWLRTGDIAYYDNDGYFYITDRMKELIKVRGHQVAPAELEALLLTHPNIVDAAVTGIHDDYSGELPRAYVVRREKPVPKTIISNEDDTPTPTIDTTATTTTGTGMITESDIYAWVKERVAGYKRLDGGIIFVDAIPKSASGKILRRILRDEAKLTMD